MGKDTVREKIISESIQLFMNYGVRSVTMDEIAKHLGMSKKTIYQHFKDKEEIIIQATSLHFDKEHQLMDEIEKGAENAVEHLYKLTILLRDRIKKTNTKVLWDLQKYYQTAWNKYKQYKHEVIYNSVVKNILRGMDEGLFRDDLNPDILAHLRVGEIEMSFNEDFFPEHKFDLVEIHEQLFIHFTYGILSEKGLKLFETYKLKEA